MKSSKSNHETPETSMQAPENPEKFDCLDTAASESVFSNVKNESLENVSLNLNPDVTPKSTSASLKTEASESAIPTLNSADSPHALDTEVIAAFKIASDEKTARKSILNPEAQEFIPTVPRSSNQSTEQAQSRHPNIYYENQIFFAQYPLAQHYPTMLLIPTNQYAHQWNNYAPTYTQNYGWQIQPYLNATPQMAPADCKNHSQENIWYHPEAGNFEVSEDKTPTMISPDVLPLDSGNGSSQAPPRTKPNQTRSKRKHQKKSQHPK